MAENEKVIVVQKTANQLFRTKKIWQYDVGHTLRFDGFNLPYTFEVHFAHSLNGESQKQIGQDGICEVPAEYTIHDDPLDVQVADFLASMTDRFAIRLYEQLNVPRAWGLRQG